MTKSKFSTAVEPLMTEVSHETGFEPGNGSYLDWKKFEDEKPPYNTPILIATLRNGGFFFHATEIISISLVTDETGTKTKYDFEDFVIDQWSDEEVKYWAHLIVHDQWLKKPKKGKKNA